jgi:hypothetical protein
VVQDECGVCGGSGIPDGECDCDGNVLDCAEVCGGISELDYCGECNGNNDTCSHCANEYKINYTDNSTPQGENIYSGCKDPRLPSLCPSSDIEGAPTYNFICDDLEYGVACDENDELRDNVFIQPSGEAVPWELMHAYCIDENGQTKDECKDNTIYEIYPILLEQVGDCDTNIPEWGYYTHVSLQVATDDDFANIVGENNFLVGASLHLSHYLDETVQTYIRERFRIKILFNVATDALAADVETSMRLTYFSDFTGNDGIVFVDTSGSPQEDTISHASREIYLDTFGNDLLGDAAWWDSYNTAYCADFPTIDNEADCDLSGGVWYPTEDWVWKVELITRFKSDNMELDHLNWAGDNTITFHLTAQEECSLLGDMNGDGGWNVLDIVALANCVLANTCTDYDNACAGDMNGDWDGSPDSGFNVLDIVALANCVLAGNCG